MTMRHIVLICAIISMAGSPTVAETEIYFDLIHHDKVVGSLKASQKTDGPKTYYQSVTNIKTKLIKGIKVDYEYDVTFDGQLLQKADVHITVNENPHAETSTVWKDDRYEIVKNNKMKSTLESAINYATILLYFKEPTDINNCYSEQDGSLNTIVSLGNHTYKKINAKGKENTYHYEKGVLKKANIDGGIVNFEMVARE